MDIKSLLSIGNEKQSLNKLVKLLKNPSSFFQNNRDTEEQLLDYLTFVVRLDFVIVVLTGLIIDPNVYFDYLFPLIIGLFFAKIFAIITLVIGSLVLNLITKVISRKNDLMAAKRIVAYCSVFLLFYGIPVIGLLFVFPLSIAICVIGISRQYKISFFKAIIVETMIFIVVGILFCVYWVLWWSLVAPGQEMVL